MYLSLSGGAWSWYLCPLELRFLDSGTRAAGFTSTRRFMILYFMHKVDSGEGNSPAAPAGIPTRNLSITGPALLPTSYPGSLLLCVLTLIRCPFHPRVTAVACKRPRSFCQKCRWKVTHKYAYTLDPAKSGQDPQCIHSAGTYQERAHTQLVGEHSATVVSAH